MLMPIKTVDMQLEEIVKYTSFFKGVQVEVTSDKKEAIIFCPEYKVWDVLCYYFPKNGYPVTEAKSNPDLGDFIFKINLVEPSFTLDQLDTMIINHLASLNDLDTVTRSFTEYGHAVQVMKKFAACMGIHLSME